jgi:hypothetical protein
VRRQDVVGSQRIEGRPVRCRERTDVERVPILDGSNRSVRGGEKRRAVVDKYVGIGRQVKGGGPAYLVEVRRGRLVDRGVLGIAGESRHGLGVHTLDNGKRADS